MNMRAAARTGSTCRSGHSSGTEARRRVAFWVAGGTLALFFSGASAASSDLRRLPSDVGFSATGLTAIFAVYFIGVLAAVLPASEFSDQVGRRPVIIAGLALQMVATALFLVANQVALLFVARVGNRCGFSDGRYDWGDPDASSSLAARLWMRSNHPVASTSIKP